MDILVVGGAGFIGSNLVEAINKEHNVTVMDNFITGSLENLSDIGPVRIIHVPADGKKALPDSTDVIFFEAGSSSAPMYMPDPSAAIKNTLMDFIEYLNYAKEQDAKIIYATSSSLYSRCKPPHREDMQIVPGTFYEATRLAIENYAKIYTELYGVKAIGLRYFSVYGPKEEAKKRFANLISQFMWAMAKEESPVVYGDGNQTRDFTYVKDVVRANLLAMKSGKTGIFNIGTGVSHTVNDMIRILNECMGKDIKPKYVANPIKNYVYDTLADTMKSEKELGFKAEYSLRKGIQELVKRNEAC